MGQVKFSPAAAQLVERQTVESTEICWSLVRFRAAGSGFLCVTINEIIWLCLVELVSALTLKNGE